MTGDEVLPVTRIRPDARAASVTAGEVWQARELLYFLVWRDIKVRYKHTVLGIADRHALPAETLRHAIRPRRDLLLRRHHSLRH